MLKVFENIMTELAGATHATENKRTMPIVKIKRVYDKPLKRDGFRILVDRLWPRGLSKKEAALDEWAKELAPSTFLRNWFDHDPYYWEQFRKKYTAELKQNEALPAFLDRHREKKLITLVYATRYDKLAHALVLREYIENMYGDT